MPVESALSLMLSSLTLMVLVLTYVRDEKK
ncbi:putative holin-like toxin [Candidatus Enterococcus murrayae]